MREAEDSVEVGMFGQEGQGHLAPAAAGPPTPSLTPGDTNQATTPSLATTSQHFSPVGTKSSLPLRPWPEENDSHPEKREDSTLRVVSLNLGGRNTNPVEFELKGDRSELAMDAMTILRKAAKAMGSAKEGPVLMPDFEMKVVKEILAEVFGDSPDEEPSDGQARIRKLLGRETWSQVLKDVRAMNPHMFNALNLYTLKLNRPSVWENPASCKEFTNTKEYLIAWKQWYRGLDRSGNFWLEDAPRVANKRGIDVPTAFAGLLLFDLMCLCTCRRAMPSIGKDDDFDGISDDTREVPFADIARFAAKLPASSLTARHTVAQKIAEDAHALLAQEARSFANHPTIAEEFLPPFCAQDGFTAVFLRKDSFKDATDITAAVARKVEELGDDEEAQSPQAKAKAWKTTASRLAAVLGRCHPDRGGFKVCLVSLHASKSDCTADFLIKLREVLDDYDADINIVGMDSNCGGADTAEFQKRLWGAGFEIGCAPKQQQVTVAKQRTAFQTQVNKVGDLDVSHKDYIVSWTSPKVSRGPTSYTPDLRTSYGVDQETKQCVRLPTTEWPFDHCGVATSFKQRFRCRAEMRCSWRTCGIAAMVTTVLLIASMPLGSPTRSGLYGEPGAWYHDGWISVPRLGICETSAPCPPGWKEALGSCYLTTPKLNYPDLREHCSDAGGLPISIHSEEENQLVVNSLCPRGDFCYIGLLADNLGNLRWESGLEVNYSQLVHTFKVPIPLFEDSRSTDYVATMVANMPGEVSGCDARNTFALSGGEITVVDIIQNALPVIAMAWSGFLLVQPRPPGQRLASLLILLGFCTNASWASHKLFNACYVNGFNFQVTVFIFGSYMAAGGHTTSSLVAFWLIVRRMNVLYDAKALKLIFYALFGIMNFFFTVTATFIDERAPIRYSWPMILVLILSGVIIVLYGTTSFLMSRDLYRTWASLHREATNGCSTQGKTLAQLVRSAKIHFFAVFFAILTGAVRWMVLLAIMLWMTLPAFVPATANAAFMFASFVDSMTNDFCAHALSVLNMDAAVMRAKGVTTEVAERAEREVEQHRLAVHLLKAAPTSMEQLQQLARLESKARSSIGTNDEKSSFLILQSAVRVETARIHRLMYCVRIRAMTMQLRYQPLIEVPTMGSAPRQHIPEQFRASEHTDEAHDQYFKWLYGEAPGAQQVLFQQMQQLLARFNNTQWPSDLGLAPEEFPWRIWAGAIENSGNGKRLQPGEVISPGDTWVHVPRKSGCLSRTQPPAICIALEETSKDRVLIQRSGTKVPQEVPREELRRCQGGGVFVPGPMKKVQRVLDKIDVDYKDSAPWPAAASVVDICRCTILCDDPYAIAVLVAFLRKTMSMVRCKNRFSEDVLESHGAEELQKMFYAASDTSGSDSQTTTSTHCYSSDQQYRDISINLAVTTPNGVPFICELQVSLASLAILKQADTTLYTVRRMKSPQELVKTRVFNEDTEASDKAAPGQSP